MTRTFIAIELDDATHAYLGETVRQLAPALPGVRFVDPATWHLTLAFLGELDDAALAAAHLAARQAAAMRAPFTLRAQAPGIFGAPQLPRVIWMGLGGDLVALSALYRRLAAELQSQGLATDGRFAPHITLARPKQPLTPAGADALAEACQSSRQGPTFAVDAIAVMRSDLRPTGAQYTRLERVPLGAPA